MSSFHSSVCFCYVRFGSVLRQEIGSIGRASLKWPVLCRVGPYVGRKTLTQSISPQSPFAAHVHHVFQCVVFHCVGNTLIRINYAWPRLHCFNASDEEYEELMTELGRCDFISYFSQGYERVNSGATTSSILRTCRPIIVISVIIIILYYAQMAAHIT